MLDMKLTSGKFIIDDNDQVHVDDNIKKQIEEAFENNEDNKNKNKPDLIKD